MNDKNTGKMNSENRGHYTDEGKVVTYSGRASNTDEGALLMYHASIDDVPIYIEGMSAWPEEYANKEVIVTGMLLRENEDVDPHVIEYYLKDVSEIKLSPAS